MQAEMVALSPCLRGGNGGHAVNDQPELRVLGQRLIEANACAGTRQVDKRASEARSPRFKLRRTVRTVAPARRRTRTRRPPQLSHIGAHTFAKPPLGIEVPS